MLAPCKPTPLEKHGTEELIDTYPDSKVRFPGGNPTRKNRWATTPLAFFGGRPPPARRLPSSSRSFRNAGKRRLQTEGDGRETNPDPLRCFYSGARDRLATRDDRFADGP